MPTRLSATLPQSLGRTTEGRSSWMSRSTGSVRWQPARTTPWLRRLLRPEKLKALLLPMAVRRLLLGRRKAGAKGAAAEVTTGASGAAAAARSASAGGEVSGPYSKGRRTSPWRLRLPRTLWLTPQQRRPPSAQRRRPMRRRRRRRMQFQVMLRRPRRRHRRTPSTDTGWARMLLARYWPSLRATPSSGPEGRSRRWWPGAAPSSPSSWAGRPTTAAGRAASSFGTTATSGCACRRRRRRTAAIQLPRAALPRSRPSPEPGQRRVRRASPGSPSSRSRRAARPKTGMRLTRPSLGPPATEVAPAIGTGDIDAGRPPPSDLRGRRTQGPTEASRRPVAKLTRQRLSKTPALLFRRRALVSVAHGWTRRS
mmetsp:Transcript_79083/g.235650  ORF Transcript_79083/g.235650 Transcript_79083/m.235650 type:complete len:368 (+) Transcript_79083:1492-2595(+)